MRRVLSAIIIAATVLSWQQHPLAWHAKGHMAVAYIAWQRLTPAMRRRVTTLLAKNPSIGDWRRRLSSVPAAQKDQMMFLLAAVWPDDIKSDPRYDNTHDTANDPLARQNIGYSDHFQHRSWHYVDHPFSEDGTPLIPVPGVNAEERIERFRQTIASSADDDVKSYDLVWLEHLVGDVHQPLHATTRVSAQQSLGDFGGNSVTLTLQCRGCPAELHAFWDGVVGETHRPTVAAAFGMTLEDPDERAAAIDDVATWTNESFRLARSTVYVPPIGAGAGPFSLTAAYRSAALDIARERIALGGARLANLINANLR